MGLYHFEFPPAVNESSCCLTSSSAFSIISVLDFGHSNRCVVVSHCGYNLHFPLTYDVEHLLYAYLPCASSLVRCLFKLLLILKIGSSIFLSFSYKSSLYILDIIPLLGVSFANTFSQAVACLLTLLPVSFSEQKFLISMKSSLSIICFMDCVFLAFYL